MEISTAWCGIASSGGKEVGFYNNWSVTQNCHELQFGWDTLKLQEQLSGGKIYKKKSILLYPDYQENYLIFWKIHKK